MGQVFNLEKTPSAPSYFGNYLHHKGRRKSSPPAAARSAGRRGAVIGRVVNRWAKPIDGARPIASPSPASSDIGAPASPSAKPVSRPLLTGIQAVDSLIPIGRGQRELIIGDRKTGRPPLAIGHAHSTRRGWALRLLRLHGEGIDGRRDRDVNSRRGAMGVTEGWSSPPPRPAPLQYIAPYAGCTMAEYSVEGRGDDVVYDELSKAGRARTPQLSRLLRRPPAARTNRVTVFYLHSRLLERAVKASDANAAGRSPPLPDHQRREGEV